MYRGLNTSDTSSWQIHLETTQLYLTPNGAYEHIKESVIEYLETAYKISHPDLNAERAEALRERGIVAQSPFIEATPAFPTDKKLAELERNRSDILPQGLAELVQHGVPVDRFPLYVHQQASLLQAYSDKPNLMVATGTGSGKTECFLLPILSDILREAISWKEPTAPPQPGRYDGERNVWLHSRRHESRPAALRSIVLYPMNALVNDQLSRLRRILARNMSPDWQRRNLNGNVIHFAMYTGMSRPTGSWSQEGRRQQFDKYIQQIAADWKVLREDLKDTGMWARPQSPEMLCRWDVQMAPPDILVTNYSMLEYMLIRPIENQIFEATRLWLAEHPEARFTLVLDEAHTYTGAKGTEVAYLVRRLKERLGLPNGSPQFRAIATTASVPDMSRAEKSLYRFISDLFDEPEDRFSLIKATATTDALPERVSTGKAFHAFKAFHQNFDVQAPFPAIERLANALDLGAVDSTLDPQVALFNLLEHSQDVTWTRQRTARKATLLNDLSAELWPQLGEAQEKEEATSGILSAGSFARPSETTDTPPLLSMRIHAFFRGIGGIWACMNPECPEVHPKFRHIDRERPVGKLYLDPRPWCSDQCGGRVLEVFSCRHCGLLFLGGIPDATQGSLWPWSDDLSGERQDVREYRIFGVESPYPDAITEHRSIKTTLSCHPNAPYHRLSFEIEEARERDSTGIERIVSPFPQKCPRCQAYRQPGVEGREVIEPLRTRGPRAFSAVVEDAFRVQPRARHGVLPNYGRKALLFTDSRQDAAILAADLRTYHHTDLFRQLLYRVLHQCARCAGGGNIEETGPYIIGQQQEIEVVTCPECSGSGISPSPQPLSFEEVRARVIGLQIHQEIDPTNQKVSKFFTERNTGSIDADKKAEMAFNVALRREISEDTFALEPLGLASWRIQLPENTGAFTPLSVEETQIFIRSVARILATENVILPPEPHKPWEWPADQVKEYEMNVIIPASKRVGKAIPYNLSHFRKLGRYVIAVSRALVVQERLANDTAAQRWVDELHWPLWKALTGFKVLEWAGAKIDNQIPQGLRLEKFELHPITSGLVHQCQACAYVMSETLCDVCIRCGQPTNVTPASSIRSYYRRAAQYSLPDIGFDDPYPIRAIEHTAQIPGAEARDIERWFQDLFHDHQNRADHRIDVLSVTTTMEMGIDIGSLLSVGMRNVPPTVANYQQRAGRAGRRGSSIATVLTFAQQRSHDQYYFASPPEIVSEPPRVPSLYLRNEVIARRHVRSICLQSFFYQELRGYSNSNLFDAWGSVSDFANHSFATKIQHYLSTNRAPLSIRCRDILPPELAPLVGGWLDNLLVEVQEVVSRQEAKTGLLEALMISGLLPKYAFPVDVVGMSIPDIDAQIEGSDSDNDDDTMQRDLKIALAEYAPGAEVVRGAFPKTYIYKSAGVYNSFEATPNYHPTGLVVECADCQAIELLAINQMQPVQCRECHGFNLLPMPYLRPRGFTVDAALPEAGRVEYEGGGRERAGYATPARLQVGETSLHNGQSCATFAPNLYTHVRVGELFMCNKGVDRQFPGFLICPTCGRALDPDDSGAHTYPANVPPHRGYPRGPRAGERCPNRKNINNQVLLGHKFYSEVILFGVDLPEHLDAPFLEPAGRAVWYSFGTLLADAANRVLQINVGELKVGIRSINRGAGRIHGEVFIYDDVPGGAGYARAIQSNLEEILNKALALGRHCPNPDCTGACYHCLYEYGNQMLHPFLDRRLGVAVLEFLLEGKSPVLSMADMLRYANGFVEFARSTWTIEPGASIASYYFPYILKDTAHQQYGLWVLHPLLAKPVAQTMHAILAEHRIRCAVHYSFDLERRPFWVHNHFIRES